MFNFKKLISADYLFKVDTVLMHRSDRLILFIGIGLVAVGIITWLTGRFAPNQFSRKLWRRIATLSFVIGLLEVFWYGIRFENIPVLGTHAAAFLVLIVGVLWLIPIVRYRLRGYRADIASWEKEQVKQKYLDMNTK